MLQRDLPRRDACRRMVELLFIAHEHACETELAHLLAADLDASRVPDPKALATRLVPRIMALPRDIAVAHSPLDSFDALLEAERTRAQHPGGQSSHGRPGCWGSAMGR